MSIMAGLYRPTGWLQKTGTLFVHLNFIRLNFIKYRPIFKFISPSESATIENQTISVTKHFKKLTKQEKCLLLSKVTVASSSFFTSNV